MSQEHWAGLNGLVYLCIICAVVGCSSHWQTTISQEYPNSYIPQIRTYYVAAEPIQWDYAPSGQNLIKPGKGLGEWGQKVLTITFCDDDNVELFTRTIEKSSK